MFSAVDSAPPPLPSAPESILGQDPVIQEDMNEMAKLQMLFSKIKVTLPLLL